MSYSEQNLLSTDVFFKDNFGIDEYLSKCTQKSDLLTLKKDLKYYGMELYAIMVDILKTETEDIINLAESLTNLNSKIDELSTPVSQLCEEIRSLFHTISDAKCRFKKHLDIIQSMGDEKDRLNLQMGILSSSAYINNVISVWEEEDITVLERAVNEYSFQYLYLKELGLSAVILDEDVQSTANRLIELIHVVFLKALKASDEEIILRCLRMYMNLGRQTEAEICVREKVALPILRKIFTQKNLDDHAQDVNPLYFRAIDFLNGDLKPLLTILDTNPDLNGYNFVVNSFWVEVDKQLRENLPNITAPGNPDLFQKRFQNTWLFLQKIVAVSKVPQLFQKDPSFEAHMKRFNLPVYFEIRFQQIATKFEATMVNQPTEFCSTNASKQMAGDLAFKLTISMALWSGIKRCFHQEVFLVHVVDQILKLMLLLLSRYLKWFDGYLNKPKGPNAHPDADKMERFIIYSLVDFDILKSLIAFSVEDISEIDKTIFKVIPNEMRLAFLTILQTNGHLLDSMHLRLREQIVSTKVQQCAPHLQQVTSIPRLYRRTNRSIPKDPSNYIIEAINPIKKLHDKYKNILEDKIALIMDLIIARLSEQYLSLVREVLRSVCKTEESLRRLKSRNLNVPEDSLGHVGSDATSDEAKIREQIKLDVGYLIREVKLFSLNEGKHSIKFLIQESGYVDPK